MVLQKARDESHRFAINFNRSNREKAYQKNILEEIPGIWPKTRKKLIAKFGSPSGFHQIPSNSFAEIISKKQMKALQEYWLII